jgi:hypothetical protein
MSNFINKKKLDNSRFKDGQNGFALLFSVLLSSLLLSIGLSIFRIALKELDISSASRYSINAFYAADSGRECISYWDTKKNKVPNLLNEVFYPKISCGNKDDINLATSTTYSGAGFASSDRITITVPTIYIGTSTDSAGPNFNIFVEKTITDRNDFEGPIQQKVISQTISTGYNFEGGDRVERAIDWIE